MPVVVPLTTQVMVLFVTPGTSDVALTVRSVSGESVKETPSGVPLEQLAAALTVTSMEAVSIAYPLGALVSVTVEVVPIAKPSKHA